jgi:dTDP-4-amino-4,6-dideoxygalactose transaminase
VKIPITKPCFDFHEKEAVASVLDSGWVVQGPRVAEFELLFAEFTGARYARAVSSCTAALHLALETLGIGEGDRVIVPSFTYVASANAVEYTGAEVLFCDIDLATFTIDVGQLRGFLEGDKEGRIKAIMPVHLFGLCAAMPEIMEIATQYGVKVVEDGACGFDAWIGERHGGTFGDAGCFSFHPRKSLTTGEGGMVVTDSEEVAGRITMLRDHGAGKSDLKRHLEEGGSLLPPFELRGYNYRMTDLQGALGVCQMKKASEIQRRRRAVAKRYDEYLREIDILASPVTPDGYTHGYQSYVCLFIGGEQLSSLNREKIDGLNLARNRLMERLEKRGVSTRQGTHAVHTLGYYRTRYDLTPEDYINSYGADRLSIALPLYASLSEEEQEYVIEAIIACAE